MKQKRPEKEALERVLKLVESQRGERTISEQSHTAVTTIVEEYVQKKLANYSKGGKASGRKRHGQNMTIAVEALNRLRDQDELKKYTCQDIAGESGLSLKQVHRLTLFKIRQIADELRYAK